MKLERFVDTEDVVVPQQKLTDKIQITQLPSQFKPYPEGAKIYYDTYTYQEIKDLSNKSLDLSYKNKLMLSGIHCTFPSENLTYDDFIHISFLRKLSSLNSSSFSFKYRCSCSEKLLVKNFETKDLEFVELQCELPITIDFYSIPSQTFTPLTIGGFLHLIDTGKYYREVNGVTTEDEIARLAMYTGIKNFEASYKLFSELKDGRDIELLMTLDDFLYHGLDVFKFVCNNKLSSKDETGKEILKFCTVEHQRDLEGGDLLIYPFRGENDDAKTRIHFGKSRSM